MSRIPTSIDLNLFQLEICQTQTQILIGPFLQEINIKRTLILLDPFQMEGE